MILVVVTFWLQPKIPQLNSAGINVKKVSNRISDRLVDTLENIVKLKFSKGIYFLYVVGTSLLTIIERNVTTHVD